MQPKAMRMGLGDSQRPTDDGQQFGPETGKCILPTHWRFKSLF